MPKSWLRRGVVPIGVALNGLPLIDTAAMELPWDRWVEGLGSTIRKTVRGKRKRVELAFVHGEPLLFPAFRELLWNLQDADMVWSARSMLPSRGFQLLRGNPALSENCVEFQCLYVPPTVSQLDWALGARPFVRRVWQLERKGYPVVLVTLNEEELDRILPEFARFQGGRLGAEPMRSVVDPKAFTYLPLSYQRKGELPCRDVLWLIGPDGGFYPCFSQAMSEYQIREREGELGELWSPPKQLRMCRAKECIYGDEERVTGEVDGQDLAAAEAFDESAVSD